MDTEQLMGEIRELGATVNRVDYAKRGYHLEVALSSQQLRGFATLLKSKDFYLVFVCGVHLVPDMEVVYQFASHARPCRIVARSFVDATGSIPTICDIYQGANWHERETRDMFGIQFHGHPYLQPLLLPEDDADLRPLLKTDTSLRTAGQIRWQDGVSSGGSTAAAQLNKPPTKQS